LEAVRERTSLYGYTRFHPFSRGIQITAITTIGRPSSERILALLSVATWVL
jgi:hypothetical protein